MSEHQRKTVTLKNVEPGHGTRHGTGYLDRAFGDPAELVYNAMKLLKGIEPFDTMVGRGLSGALVVPILARAMGKFFAVVRKSNEGCHSSSCVEGRLGDKWIFVDDLISTGSTFDETGNAVFQTKPTIRCYGYYLYGCSYELAQAAGRSQIKYWYTDRGREWAK